MSKIKEMPGPMAYAPIARANMGSVLPHAPGYVTATMEQEGC